VVNARRANGKSGRLKKGDAQRRDTAALDSVRGVEGRLKAKFYRIGRADGNRRRSDAKSLRDVSEITSLFRREDF
jgi:hypothetical protein